MVSLSSLRATRVLGAVTATLLVGGVAFAAPTSGRMMRVPVDGAGSVACAVTGSLSFNPPLVAGGVATTEIVTLRTRLTGCQGSGDGANVKSGSAVISGTTDTNDCIALLLTPRTGERSGPLKWTAVPKTARLNPSAITFDSTALTSGATDTDPITIDSSGTVGSGSFTGDAAVAHTVLKELPAVIKKHCLNVHGLRAFHFAAGSTFTLTAPTPPAP